MCTFKLLNTEELIQNLPEGKTAKDKMGQKKKAWKNKWGIKIEEKGKNQKEQ